MQTRVGGSPGAQARVTRGFESTPVRNWLKAHETHFSRARMMETADLTGIPMRSVMGPINYRPLKLLESPGFIVELPKHRTSIARIRLATPAQLRVVDKLVEPKEMELSDTAYEGAKLADDPRYGKPCGSAQLAKTLTVYDRADPAAARLIIVTGSDFEGTSPKLFWPKTLVYSLPGAELNQMLTLVVAIKSEMPCEPELLLFEGMNDHLHAAGLLEQLKGDEPTPNKNLGGYPDVVCPDERGAGKCQFAIWTQDESGIHDVHRIREHASCSAVCVCYSDPNSRRERMADPDGSSQSRAGTHEVETLEVRTGSGGSGRVPRIEGIL